MTNPETKTAILEDKCHTCGGNLEAECTLSAGDVMFTDGAKVVCYNANAVVGHIVVKAGRWSPCITRVCGFAA
jgi:hypothetical protein